MNYELLNVLVNMIIIICVYFIYISSLQNFLDFFFTKWNLSGIFLLECVEMWDRSLGAGTVTTTYTNIHPSLHL